MTLVITNLNFKSYLVNELRANLLLGNIVIIGKAGTRSGFLELRNAHNPYFPGF